LSINTISTTNNSVKVFPNPFTETANIQIEDFQNSDNWSIQLFLTGKVVRAASIQTAPFTLQKENLSAGVYFYQINNSQQQKQYTGKLIVQ
jgi:hypothetical protein